jgi:hypothetical protein
VTRTKKTPQQRAEEALAAAERNVERLDKRVKQLSRDHDQAVEDLGKAERRRDYLAQNPDLDPPVRVTPNPINHGD